MHKSFDVPALGYLGMAGIVEYITRSMDLDDFCVSGLCFVPTLFRDLLADCNPIKKAGMLTLVRGLLTGLCRKVDHNFILYSMNFAALHTVENYSTVKK